MKKIYDFVFCRGSLTPDVVIYHVLVGQSERDRKAAAYIGKLAEDSSDYLWGIHSTEMATFFDRIEDSLFAGSQLAQVCCHGLLRKKFIAVTQLAHLLRSLPPCLLNSSRVETSCAFSQMLGTSKFNARSASKPSCLPATL